MTLLHQSEIFKRIDVLPPYYALTEVELVGDNHIRAKAPVQQPLGVETGPITGAEAGRHLAIAGSIAAAWANPRIGRFHYLAIDAEIRRAKSVSECPIGLLRLDARAQLIDKRTAHAIVTATGPDGTPVCSLSCYYAVVGYDAMRKMFSGNLIETPVSEANPYLTLIEPDRVDVAGGHIEVQLGPVDPAACAGHFDGLPAMPVAYLMSNVTSAAARLLRHTSEDSSRLFTVIEGSVRADGLAFAGESVVLKGEHQGTRYGLEWVYLEAFAAGDKRVGAVHLKLDSTPSG